MTKWLRRWRLCTSGQGLVEYALIIGMVAVVLVSVLLRLRDSTGGSSNRVGNTLAQVAVCNGSAGCSGGSGSTGGGSGNNGGGNNGGGNNGGGNNGGGNNGGGNNGGGNNGGGNNGGGNGNGGNGNAGGVRGNGH